MVRGIDPSYYAAGNIKGDFTLVGLNFSLIPADAVAILSGRNDAPDFQRFSTSNSWLGAVNVIDDTHLEVLQDMERPHSTPVYLGMIVSNDRQTVYWVNNTRPLP